MNPEAREVLQIYTVAARNDNIHLRVNELLGCILILYYYFFNFDSAKHIFAWIVAVDLENLHMQPLFGQIENCL